MGLHGLVQRHLYFYFLLTAIDVNLDVLHKFPVESEVNVCPFCMETGVLYATVFCFEWKSQL
jgi:hypothetical protein